MGIKFAAFPYVLGVNRDREKPSNKIASERRGYIRGILTGEGQLKEAVA
jgi:hypothetical protein